VNDLATELLGPAKEIPPTRSWVPAVGEAISFTILGQPCSKANSRRLARPFVKEGETPRMIFMKSKEALIYERDALRQIPSRVRVRLTGPVCVTLRIWYASELPDLDESIILDVLQDRWDKRHGPRAGENKRQLVQAGVYRNDRQVREKHVFHGIDKANPRAEITVQALVAQQESLL
jgi:hypothetical protein